MFSQPWSTGCRWVLSFFELVPAVSRPWVGTGFMCLIEHGPVGSGCRGELSFFELVPAVCV